MLAKLKKYHFLFTELVKRDFKKKYKRTVLGVFWSVLAPLLSLMVMNLVFMHLFGRNTPHYLIYLFAGNLVLTYFSESTNQGMHALVGNAAIFTRVNIPKYYFVFSKNVQTFINFLINLCIFFIFCLLDQITFSWNFILLVFPIICLLVFNIGMSMILSALYVFFRDMQYLWSVFLQLLSYLSAVFYDIKTFPQNVQGYFLLNPVYVYIKYLRTVVIDGMLPDLQLHLLAFGYALVSLLVGVWIYKKNNTKFLYYV